MNIVIDASALIAVIANEPEKESLVRHTNGASLLAPQSVHFEIGNAFSAMFKRRRIALEDARTGLAIYQSIPIRFVDVELVRSVEIAARYDIYAYDAYLIRCAEKHRAPLLTLDQALYSHALAHGLAVLEVSS